MGFRERPHDKKRRLARMEAKRLLLDELERKKVSLITNQVFMQRDYPLRPWARPPPSLKRKMRQLAQEVTVAEGDDPVEQEMARRIQEELAIKVEAAQAKLEETARDADEEELSDESFDGSKVRTITSEKDI